MKDSGPQKKVRTPASRVTGHPRHRLLQERPHPVPVGRDLAEGEVLRDPVDLPRRRLRLEEADHHPAALLAVVAVRRGVLEDRRVRGEPVDGVGDQVVVLGGLVRDHQAVLRAELAGPHAGAVDDVLALDVGAASGGRAPSGGRARRDPRHPAAVRADLVDRHALDDADAELPGALGQRGGDVDRVHAAVAGDVEAGEQVVGARPREQVGHLPRRDLVDLQPLEPLEGGDPAVLLEPGLVGRRLDQPDRLEAGGLTGLLLEAGVEVAGVEPDRGRGLRGGAEAGHQAGGVPGGAGGEPVALEEDDVGPARVREVVGDRAADDASADDHDAGTLGHLAPGRSGGHRPNLLPAGGIAAGSSALSMTWRPGPIRQRVRAPRPPHLR